MMLAFLSHISNISVLYIIKNIIVKIFVNIFNRDYFIDYYNLT
jgi:hypothetical protein